jgi:hypothetical protein
LLLWFLIARFDGDKSRLCTALHHKWLGSSIAWLVAPMKKILAVVSDG